MSTTTATQAERIQGARDALAAMQAQRAAEWELCKADARRHRFTAQQVQSFRSRQRLGFAAPLSADAAALLREQLETDRRIRNGEQRALELALACLAERATPAAAAAVAAVVPSREQLLRAGAWPSMSALEAYLIGQVEALTGKRYAQAAAAIKRAAALVPAAAPAAAGLDRCQLLLFWGVVLRLGELEGPPPADPAAFYRWSRLEAYATPSPAQSLRDLLAGQMQEGEARALLQLPATAPLAPAGIRSAYRALAREHHPDAGGDRQRFEQLSTARDRLLIAAAAAP